MTHSLPETIELTVRIAASPETVFRFFSDPKRYRLWMGEQSTMQPGRYGKLTVSFGPGPTAIGKIIEWAEPERIVFDWSHEGSAEKPSRVTVLLEEQDGGTLVTLRHEGISDAMQREGTASGWKYYLSTLANKVLGEQLSEAAPAAVATYLSVWSMTDSKQRLATLATCVTADVRFRDQYGAIDGREALSDYIGGAQRMLGPAILKADGPLDRVHCFLRQDWVVQGPDGKGLFRGQNFYELNEQAHFRLIVGFWL